MVLKQRQCTIILVDHEAYDCEFWVLPSPWSCRSGGSGCRSRCPCPGPCGAGYRWCRPPAPGSRPSHFLGHRLLPWTHKHTKADVNTAPSAQTHTHTPQIVSTGFSEGRKVALVHISPPTRLLSLRPGVWPHTGHLDTRRIRCTATFLKPRNRI